MMHDLLDDMLVVLSDGVDILIIIGSLGMVVILLIAAVLGQGDESEFRKYLKAGALWLVMLLVLLVASLAAQP